MSHPTSSDQLGLFGFIAALCPSASKLGVILFMSISGLGDVDRDFGDVGVFGGASIFQQIYSTSALRAWR